MGGETKIYLIRLYNKWKLDLEKFFFLFVFFFDTYTVKCVHIKRLGYNFFVRTDFLCYLTQQFLKKKNIDRYRHWYLLISKDFSIGIVIGKLKWVPCHLYLQYFIDGNFIIVQLLLEQLFNSTSTSFLDRTQSTSAPSIIVLRQN